MASKQAEIVVLVRADGHGELRDAAEVTRMHAADADELRGLLMMRALQIAAERGHALSVTTIDVDGIYDLRITAEGNVEELGERRSLAPGDDALTPEPAQKPAPTRDPDGGYAALFGLSADELSTEVDVPTVPVHETERLPREAMMAKLNYDELLSGEEVASNEDAPISLQGVFDAADESGAFAQGIQPFADSTAAEQEPVLPARSDAPAGGHSTAESLSLAQETAAITLPRDTGKAAHTETPTQPALPPEDAPLPPLAPLAGAAVVEEHLGDGEWQPRFLRQEHSAPKASPAPVQPKSAPSMPEPDEVAPTLDDFFAGKHHSQDSRPAELGWRAALRRITGGLISLGPGVTERERRVDLDKIQRSFSGSRTIVVMNPKGGAHKTTATLMIAATFGVLRGGYTLAWDNNETRGTLGWRSKLGMTNNTAVDLLRELPRFEISGGATISDVDRYVRHQADAKFDVLASDDDAASAAIIDDDAFSRLHSVLSRFYRIMVIDTGNNMRASNWEAALEAADQLVIVSTAREDTAASAAWLADGLRERGYGDKLANAVTIVSSPSEKDDPELKQKLTTHFQQLTRAVVAVPYDQAFVGGGELDIAQLQPSTLEAWRRAAAVIAEGL